MRFANIVREAQRPTRLVLDRFDRNARMVGSQYHFPALGIEGENSHTANNPPWPCARQALLFAPITALAKTGRGDVAYSWDEASPLVIHNNNAMLRHRRDVRRSAAAGQARSFSVVFHPVCFEVAKAIDLGASDETEIDAARLQ